jgi:hypothetical protein
MPYFSFPIASFLRSTAQIDIVQISASAYNPAALEFFFVGKFYYRVEPAAVKLRIVVQAAFCRMVF